jgi:hypothetical protein
MGKCNFLAFHGLGGQKQKQIIKIKPGLHLLVYL